MTSARNQDGEGRGVNIIALPSPQRSTVDGSTATLRRNFIVVTSIVYIVGHICAHARHVNARTQCCCRTNFEY